MAQQKKVSVDKIEKKDMVKKASVSVKKPAVSSARQSVKEKEGRAKKSVVQQAKSPVKKQSVSEKKGTVKKSTVSSAKQSVKKKVAVKKKDETLKKLAPAPKVAKSVKRETKQIKGAPAKKETEKKGGGTKEAHTNLNTVFPLPLERLELEDKPLPKFKTTKVKSYEPEARSILERNKEEVRPMPTAKYSDDDLEEFKQLILRKIEEAKSELLYLQRFLNKSDNFGDTSSTHNMMEDANLNAERENLIQSSARHRLFIDHLEKALIRIENKTYGICRITSKLIDKDRLRAVPHTTLSIEAKAGLVKQRR